jgi:hypothetical protein
MQRCDAMGRPMSLCADNSFLIIKRSATILGMICVLTVGCRSHTIPSQPTIKLDRIPSAGTGGPEQTDLIEGRVTGAKPGQQIVIYAKEDLWWVQPFSSRPLTSIGSDSTWKSATHLGTEYAVLLVEPGYHPLKKTAALPAEGNGVVAIVTVKGSATPAAALKTIHFGGYDWTLRDGVADRGGDVCDFDPRNVWTDAKGYLHLHMGEANGHWSCSEVRLTRSLGYGTYRFVVQDTAHLSPSAVLGLFTVDEQHGDEPRSELDIELSQWGKPQGHNAMFVVQPYYIPENVARFSVPPGTETYMVRWEPKDASFKAVQGSAVRSDTRAISEHVFTSGIPAPAGESVHINLYDFLHSKNKLQQPPAEVVIEKFEYLP